MPVSGDYVCSNADCLRNVAAATPEECHDHRVGVDGFRLPEIRVAGKPIEGCGWRCLRFGLGRRSRTPGLRSLSCS